MGLLVFVYRDASGGDYTNGGISSKVDQLTLINVEGPHEPSDAAPAAMLNKGPLGSMNITPVDKPAGVVGPMSGGNFAACSDSRFGKAAGFYGAVAIHDRFETQELYDALSI